VRRTALAVLASLPWALGSPAAEAAPLAPLAEAPRAAPASADPPVTTAVVASMVTILVPLVIGVSFVTAQAQVPATDGLRNAGFAVSGVGPALGPIVGHVVLGEWGRAAAFGAPTVAAEVALSAYVATMPDAVFQGTNFSRLGFGLIYSADLLGAAIGVLDVMMARERRRGPGPLGGVRVIPTVGSGRAGIVVGGAL
jgi:hypothetical protein